MATAGSRWSWPGAEAENHRARAVVYVQNVRVSTSRGYPEIQSMQVRCYITWLD